jgi:hypothetical protein
MYPTSQRATAESEHRPHAGFCHTQDVKDDVFRPQSVGRAVRTAFVLGVLVVVAIVAAVAAIDNFSALVGDNSKDELSRYLDDNEHSTIKPSGAGFTLGFPVPAARMAERVATDHGAVDAPRDSATVDDEIIFDVVWFDLPGATPKDIDRVIGSMITRQVRALSATRIAVSSKKKVGRAVARDFVAVSVDRTGVKRYYDEEIVVRGRRVWILRVGSRVRRDAAFQKFTESLTISS